MAGEFEGDGIRHLQAPDINREVYGVPQYQLREAMRNSKGPGNFRNLFVYAPGGKKDGLRILPTSEIAAKDEFLNIKNCMRDDVLVAHRVPQQLLGTMPNNTGDFGYVTKAAAVFGGNEIEPLQARFLSLNKWAGQKVVSFRPNQLPTNETK